MDIAAILQSGHSKAITASIVAYIGEDAARFKELLTIFLGDDFRLSQRASWALGHASYERPALIKPYHRQLLDALKVKQAHNSIRRNVVRTYQIAEIPEEYEAELYDICLNFIIDVHEATAVKAFSLRVCERVVEKYPEMANEVLEVIKANIEHWSSGLKNRAKKFLVRWG